MTKLQLTKPTLVLLYGYPGAGKTYFSRQFCDEVAAAHLHNDKIRHELFESPRYDKDENQILQQLMLYMTEEFLKAGVSVVYDTNAMRFAQRRQLRDLARKFDAESVLVWLQIDPDTAYKRARNRDRRKTDDKYAIDIDENLFRHVAGHMQNPSQVEDYLVLSGKHTYNTQFKMAMKRLYDKGLVNPNLTAGKIARPELINNIPNPLAGRVDPSRRNIRIH